MIEAASTYILIVDDGFGASTASATTRIRRR